MIKHQQFLHLRLNQNETLTEVLGTTIRELEKSLPYKLIEVHQVVPLANNEYTVILNGFFEDRTH
ncbi:hypothetical protein [Brevibacillus laterosporus]|uniref:hypothetical protein n=1 Tax=Brevibacillus laterosporus TaxID=1465 RepID=UPI00264C248A|nr:hypothetical protein [Brevibacillus laterosporus]MDN9012403.1 hypothetical protein [Brevibacillus laterosporus]MDO0943534.1 hypothetical protein [Brevibacillus laterosporus]